VSVTIVTRNEAARVGACLDSVSWADEIVVLDSGSTDGTQDLCRARGAIVIDRPWEGYAAQKNLAIDQTRHAWLLSLDADERVTDGLRDRILEVLASGGPADGYRIPRRNFFFGKWLRHGDLWPDHQIRLFRRDRGRFNAKAVHESVEVEGEIAELSEPIDHYSYDRVSEFFDRQVRYAALAAEDLATQGKVAGWTDFALRPLFRFLKSYILKSGWRDGREGFLVSVGSAFYVFMRAAFLWELRRERENA